MARSFLKILERNVAEKELGLRSGEGFYVYGLDDAARTNAMANAAS